MTRIVIRPQAQIDLDEIDRHGLETFGRELADSYMTGFFDAFDRLARFPEIGPVYPGLRPIIRYLPYRRHHIFYDFDGTTVSIVRVLHHARDVRSLI